MRAHLNWQALDQVDIMYDAQTSIIIVAMELDMSVRTTVHLDEDLLARLRRRVPERKISRFVNQALAEKLAELERQEIEEAMREGYIATRADREVLNADWQGVDVENWPC